MIPLDYSRFVFVNIYFYNAVPGIGERAIPNLIYAYSGNAEQNRVLKKKPVIILKTGRSAKGSEIAASHTRSLSGSDRALTTDRKSVV